MAVRLWILFPITYALDCKFGNDINSQYEQEKSAYECRICRFWHWKPSDFRLYSQLYRSITFEWALVATVHAEETKKRHKALAEIQTLNPSDIIWQRLDAFICRYLVIEISRKVFSHTSRCSSDCRESPGPDIGIRTEVSLQFIWAADYRFKTNEILMVWLGHKNHRSFLSLIYPLYPVNAHVQG